MKEEHATKEQLGSGNHWRVFQIEKLSVVNPKSNHYKFLGIYRKSHINPTNVRLDDQSYRVVSSYNHFIGSEGFYSELIVLPWDKKLVFRS